MSRLNAWFSRLFRRHPVSEPTRSASEAGEDFWAVLERARQRRELIPGMPVRRTRHGWLVSFRGLPVVGYLPDALLQDTVPSPGTPLPVRVLELNAKTGKLLVSHRHAVEPRQAGAAAAALVPGQRLRGTVIRLDRPGARVALGGVIGWLPIGLVRWGLPPTHARQVLARGQSVDVVVRTISRETGTVVVSLRDATPGPWEDVVKRYPPGTPVAGPIVRFTANKSAWVALSEGPIGFIPSPWFPARVRRTVTRGMHVRAAVVEAQAPPTERLLLRPWWVGGGEEPDDSRPTT